MMWKETLIYQGLLFHNTHAEMNIKLVGLINIYTRMIFY